MTESALVFPMLAMVLLTFSVAVVLFRARVRSVREGHTPVSYFRVFQGSPEPEFVAKPTRHFVNLFEVPTLFYAGCLAAMVTGTSSGLTLGIAWGYVGTRLLHAWIHLGGNRVRWRFRVYLTSWILLLTLWFVVCIAVARRG